MIGAIIIDAEKETEIESISHCGKIFCRPSAMNCFLITGDHKEALFLAKRLCVDYAIVKIHDLQSDTMDIVSDGNHERMG